MGKIHGSSHRQPVDAAKAAGQARPSANDVAQSKNDVAQPGHAANHQHSVGLSRGMGSSAMSLPGLEPAPRGSAAAPAAKPKRAKTKKTRRQRQKTRRGAGAKPSKAGRPRRANAVRAGKRAGRTHAPTGAAARGDFRQLAQFARSKGFTVTSTNGGRHNVGSAHYQGRAVDVRTRDKSPAQVSQFIREAREAGFKVHDERTRPPGQRVWSGPHLHLEIPRG